MGGVYTRKIIENGEITAYRTVNVANCEEQPFLKKDSENIQLRIGAFSIDPEGLEFDDRRDRKTGTRWRWLVRRIKLSSAPKKAVYRIIRTL